MNGYLAVHTVNMMIEAMAVRFGLEQAGIPTRLANSAEGYTILVPATLKRTAEDLLFPFGRIPKTEVVIL